MAKTELQSLECEGQERQAKFTNCQSTESQIPASKLPMVFDAQFVNASQPASPPAKGCVPLRIGVAVWSVTVALALILVSLIFAAPIAAATGHHLIAFTIYRGFKPLCHQIAERSFHLDNFPLAICARCLGLYVGFAGGALLYPFVRSLRSAATPARLWLILAALPTAFDFALGFSGIWANTHLSRLVTAMLLGGALVFYILPGVIDLIRIVREHHSLKKNFAGDKSLVGY